MAQDVNDTGRILRLLDANANRAREALRVLEDYARLILDDQSLCRDLKAFRHELTDCLKPHLANAMIHRDTAGDVGVTNKTAAELIRANIKDVLIAAGKRLGEALRAIEEFLKIIDPAQAAVVEALRYRFYAIEQTVAGTLRPRLFDGVRLYVLITESACKWPWLSTAEQALIGGADCLQLREKSLSGGELLSRARLLVQLCRKHGRLCIINDRPDIAVLSRADGVHVGQDDLPACEARKIIGHRMILGVSTHNIEQAMAAVRDSADYIGVGPVYRSDTKPRDWEQLPGLGYAKDAAEKIAIPATAIAGITEENVDEVWATGVGSIAVTASVSNCDDVQAAARRLKARLSSRPGFPAYPGSK